MPVLELPNEIWARISDFIPIDSLKKLYRVNSLFLEVGLDALYREATIFSKNLSEKQVKRYLQHLLQPYICRRIRTLKIQSGTFLPLIPHVPKRGFVRYPKPAKSPKPLSFLGALVSSRPAPPTESAFELASQVITQAIHAEALSLEGFSHLSQEYFDLAARAWTASTDRLQELKFRGSIIEFSRLFRGTVMPHNLQRLKLQVTEEPVSSLPAFMLPYDHDAKSAWVDFVREVSPTLTELSIEFESTGELGIAERQELLSRIFQALRPACLRSFKCNVSEKVVVLCLTPLLEFIGRAARGLHELDVPGFGASEMPDCQFRTLESLTLTNWRSPFNTSPNSENVLETAEAYMIRCSALTSLTFHGNPLPFQQLEGFLRCHSLYQSFQTLHKLQIRVQSLNPQLFTMLAEVLINLRYLTIHHHGPIPDASLEGLMDGWAASSFAMDECIPRFLEQTPLTDWQLAYLGIKPLRIPNLTSTPEKELGRALRRLIPSLIYDIEIL